MSDTHTQREIPPRKEREEELYGRYAAQRDRYERRRRARNDRCETCGQPPGACHCREAVDPSLDTERRPAHVLAAVVPCLGETWWFGRDEDGDYTVHLPEGAACIRFSEDGIQLVVSTLSVAQTQRLMTLLCHYTEGVWDSQASYIHWL